MNQEAPKPTKRPELNEAQRPQRHKNLAVLAILVGFVVLIYFITIVRMSGG